MAYGNYWMYLFVEFILKGNIWEKYLSHATVVVLFIYLLKVFDTVPCDALKMFFRLLP